MARMKRLAERIYLAWRNMRGIRLSAGDVQELIGLDDAIQTRICNEIAEDRGFDRPGQAWPSLWSPSNGSIKRFLNECRESEK